MALIYISIGSNIDREQHIRGGVAVLREYFQDLRLSRVYESAAVGFAGDAFYNLVAAARTELDVAQVVTLLHDIENRFGRERAGPRFSSRTLDMDLLLYDDVVQNGQGYKLPREEITQNAFVLWPLAEIAPDAVHPVLRQTYNELWREFDRGSQQLLPIAFAW